MNEDVKFVSIVLLAVFLAITLPLIALGKQQKRQSLEMLENECKLTELNDADIEGTKYTYLCKDGLTRTTYFDISKHAER